MKKCKGCGWDMDGLSDYCPSRTKKRSRWATPVIALLFFTIVFQSACPFSRQSAVEKAARNPGSIIISTAVSQTTPKGARHYGKFRLSDRQLDLIDEGIDALFAAAAADGFRDEARKPYDWFEIYTPPYQCTPSPVSRTPSFLVGAGYYYDGTEYDQYNTKGRLPAPQEIRAPDGSLVKIIIYKEDGLSAVYAAEYVRSIGTPGSQPPLAQFYVCPDESVLKLNVQYGGDHAYLANYSYSEEWRKSAPFDGYAYFNRSLYHGAGIGHPLLPRADRFAEDLSINVPDALAFQTTEKQITDPDVENLVSATEKETKTWANLGGGEFYLIRAVK